MSAVRGTVESMNYSACGLRVGDSFEVHEGQLRLPPGQSFCFYALASIIPLLGGHAGRDDGWLDACPLVACPDPPEALYIRLQRVPESPGTNIPGTAAGTNEESG